MTSEVQLLLRALVIITGPWSSLLLRVTYSLVRSGLRRGIKAAKAANKKKVYQQ